MVVTLLDCKSFMDDKADRSIAIPNAYYEEIRICVVLRGVARVSWREASIGPEEPGFRQHGVSYSLP